VIILFGNNEKMSTPDGTQENRGVAKIICGAFFILGLSGIIRVLMSSLPLTEFYTHSSAPKHGPSYGWQMLAGGFLLCAAAAYAWPRKR
jgi:hypothetical protein